MCTCVFPFSIPSIISPLSSPQLPVCPFVSFPQTISSPLSLLFLTDTTKSGATDSDKEKTSNKADPSVNKKSRRHTVPTAQCFSWLAPLFVLVSGPSLFLSPCFFGCSHCYISVHTVIMTLHCTCVSFPAANVSRGNAKNINYKRYLFGSVQNVTHERQSTEINPLQPSLLTRGLHNTEGLRWESHDSQQVATWVIYPGNTAYNIFSHL